MLLENYYNGNTDLLDVLFVRYMADNDFEIEVRSQSYGKSTMYLIHNGQRIYNVTFMNNKKTFHSGMIHPRMRWGTHLCNAYIYCLCAAMAANGDNAGLQVLQKLSNN